MHEHIHILHLSLSFLQVDVIVNTIAGNLELNVGEISKAILKKAGNAIQEEIKRKKRSFATSGEIFITAGHFLKCKEVYHTVCPSSSKPGAAEVALILIIQNTVMPVTVCDNSVFFFL